MPIKFLWGDEDYLIERAVDKIKQEILRGDINELNYKTFDNPSFSLLSETIRTNPMLFGDIVIKISLEKYFLSLKNSIKLDDKQTNELLEGFKNISDRVHLILICQTPRGEKKKPDSRKKLYKELIKLTKPEEFPSYRAYEEYKLKPVIKKMAQETGLKINDKEISFLIQTTGPCLRDIANVLEKIKLIIHPNDLVDIKAIQDASFDNADIFNLVDLVLKKDWIKALKLISDILSKEHYLPSLAFIQTTFTNLLKLKIYSKKYSSYDLAVKLNQNEYVVKLNLEKVKNVELDELIRLKLNLTNMEYMLKTGLTQDAFGAYKLAFLSDLGAMV